MAAYLKQGEGESLAAAVYSGSFLLMSLVFSGMNRHVLFERVDFLEEGLDEPSAASPSTRRRRPRPLRDRHRRRPDHPLPELAICAAIAVFYATQPPAPRRATETIHR